jgi:hypothetical protein
VACEGLVIAMRLASHCHSAPKATMTLHCQAVLCNGQLGRFSFRDKRKMTNQYCYFQFDDKLDSVRSAIEGVLGVHLSERESSYWGGVYFLFKDDTSDFRLRLHHNIDHRGEWISSEFKGSHVLCSISGPVSIVNPFVAKIISAGGLLLVTRIMDIDDE